MMAARDSNAVIANVMDTPRFRLIDLPGMAEPQSDRQSDRMTAVTRVIRKIVASLSAR